MGATAYSTTETQAHLVAAKMLLSKLEGIQARVAGAQTVDDVRDVLAIEVEVAKETIRTLLERWAEPVRD